MGVILGIDIGGSSTKIVGLAPDLSVIDMLRVKADDPLTSLYGAMGNFLSHTIYSSPTSAISRLRAWVLRMSRAISTV